MTKLYVTEYAGLLPTPGGGQGQVPLEPPIAEQMLDYTSGAVASNAFNAKTRVVRVHTDAICSVAIGTAPTATTSGSRMAAGQTEYHGVPINGGYKISGISNT